MVVLGVEEIKVDIKSSRLIVPNNDEDEVVYKYLLLMFIVNKKYIINHINILFLSYFQTIHLSLYLLVEKLMRNSSDNIYISLDVIIMI